MSLCFFRYKILECFGLLSYAFSTTMETKNTPVCTDSVYMECLSSCCAWDTSLALCGKPKKSIYLDTCMPFFNPDKKGKIKKKHEMRIPRLSSTILDSVKKIKCKSEIYGNVYLSQELFSLYDFWLHILKLKETGIKWFSRFFFPLFLLRSHFLILKLYVGEQVHFLLLEKCKFTKCMKTLILNLVTDNDSIIAVEFQ